MLEIDGVLFPEPTTVTWKSPRVLGHTLCGEVVLGSNWSCTLSYGLATAPGVLAALYGCLGKRMQIRISQSPFNGCELPLLAGTLSAISPRYEEGVIVGADVDVDHIVPL